MPQAAYNLGVLLARKNDKDGLRWLEKAALLAPENWDYTSTCLYFQQRATPPTPSHLFLLQIIGTGRASAEAYFSLALNYEQQGRTVESLSIYKKAKLDKRLSMDAKRHAMQQEKRLREK